MAPSFYDFGVMFIVFCCKEKWLGLFVQSEPVLQVDPSLRWGDTDMMLSIIGFPSRW